MADYNFNKPPTGYFIEKWGKNKRPHLFLEQPGIAVAFALFSDNKRAKYFEEFVVPGAMQPLERSKG